MKNKGVAIKALEPYLDSDRSTPMVCPECGGDVRCLDSRPGPEGSNSIRRRRSCCASACGFRFTTYELILDDAPLVDVVGLSKALHAQLQIFRAALDTAEEMLKSAVVLAGKK